MSGQADFILSSFHLFWVVRVIAKNTPATKVLRDAVKIGGVLLIASMDIIGKKLQSSICE